MFLAIEARVHLILILSFASSIQASWLLVHKIKDSNWWLSFLREINAVLDRIIIIIAFCKTLLPSDSQLVSILSDSLIANHVCANFNG